MIDISLYSMRRYKEGSSIKLFKKMQNWLIWYFLDSFLFIFRSDDQLICLLLSEKMYPRTKIILQKVSSSYPGTQRNINKLNGLLLEKLISLLSCKFLGMLEIQYFQIRYTDSRSFTEKSIIINWKQQKSINELFFMSALQY